MNALSETDGLPGMDILMENTLPRARLPLYSGLFSSPEGEGRMRWNRVARHYLYINNFIVVKDKTRKIILNLPELGLAQVTITKYLMFPP
jgi:hypothetical protein